MARITFEVSQEQHTYIKMMACSKGISIRDYFLAQIEKSIPAITEGVRKLGRRTRKTLEEANKHQNLHFAANVGEFYAELGLTKYVAEKNEGFIGGILKTIRTPEKQADKKAA